MKRLFAMLLALAMLLSLSVTAFAAEEATQKGSITISNATPEKEYKIYKIFDATYSTTDGKTAVAYEIDPDSKVFKLMGFDKNKETDENKYFIYNPETDAVTKKEKVNDSELIKYLTDLVTNTEEGKVLDHTAKKTAENSVVEFKDLDMGYYVITSGLGTTVTITSNTPNITVIDKNQMPFTEPGFTKQVKAAGGDYGDGVSVNVGEKMNYKVHFISSNYFKDSKIKYYQIHDEVGEAIWIDFDSIEVKVGDKTLTKGYYLNGTGKEGIKNFNSGKLTIWNKEINSSDAEFYLVHVSATEFRITIPWLKNHRLVDNNDSTFKLITDLEEDSLYNTGDEVTITYDAVLLADAVIGGGEFKAMKNTAYASAICQEETHNSTNYYTLNQAFGLGILKDDQATKKNLAGAKFRLYSDEACTKPVYLIPTDCAGVYMVDCIDTEENKVSEIEGIYRLPRQVFAKPGTAGAQRLADYLGDKTQDNYVVSQANGKLVILGLKEGPYYLKEVEAPKGYNSLTQPVELIANHANATAFSIFANSTGEVLDTQFPTGGYTEHSFNVSNTTVHNSQGVELPSTGGEGTILLITIGTIVAMAFAVLMITQKKMSIYKD